MRTTARIAALLALTTMSGSVLAQDFAMPGTSPMDYNHVQRALTNSVINKNSLNSIRRRNAGRRAVQAAPLAGSGAPSGLVSGSAAISAASAQRSSFPVTVTAAARHQANREFIERLAAKDPKAAAAMAQTLQAHDIDRIYAGITRPFGLSPDDAGDIMAAYVVLGWLIANGAPDPSPSAVRAARAQVGALLAQGGSMSDPAGRTKIAAEVKILFVTLHAGWQSARKEGNLRQYADGTAELFRTSSGDDLRRIVLTNAGFRARA